MIKKVLITSLPPFPVAVFSLRFSSFYNSAKNRFFAISSPFLPTKINVAMGGNFDGIDEETPLVNNDPQIEPPKINHQSRDLYILSSAFLLIFLAYGAAQNLETTINTEGNLGSISLGILYLSFTFFSLFASLIVRALGAKNAMVLGTTGYWFFIAANLIPSWYTMIPASLYLGFASSIIWVGEGTYLTSTARSEARYHDLHEATVIGNYNGVFWGIYASHQLLGNLLSVAFVRDGTGGSTSGTTLLFVVFLCTMTVGSILMCFLNNVDGKGQEASTGSSASLYSSLMALSKSVIAPMLDKRMLLIIPLIAYAGLQHAFVWAEFTKEVVTPAMGVSGVGIAMAVYGAFDAMCSLSAGRLTSGLVSITWIVFIGCLLEAIVFLWILLNYSLTSGILGTIYPLLMAAMLGVGDGVISTQLCALLGILFKNDMEGAFGQFRVWQSASVAVVFFISPHISLQAMSVILLTALGVAAFGFILLIFQVEKAFSPPSSR